MRHTADASKLQAQQQATRQTNAVVNHTEAEQGRQVCLSRPVHLGFDISSVCNVRCIFCLADSGRKLSTDENAFREPVWLEQLEELLPFIGVGVLSSFEAILNPKLDQFVRILRRNGTPFQVFSNGKAMTPELGEFLLRSGMISLWNSLHGARKERCETIMRGTDFDQVLHNLVSLTQIARRYKPDFALTMVFCAMRRNIDELFDYVHLAKRVGARVIQVNYLLVVKPGTGLEDEAMIFNQELYDDRVLKAKRLAASLGIVLNHQPTFFDWRPESFATPCYSPWRSVNISHTGNATVCCGGADSLGNVFEKGFEHVWNGKAMRAFRARVNSANPPEACRTCSRGRENPLDVRNHLHFLRGLTDEETLDRLEALGLGRFAGPILPSWAVQAA